MQKNENHNQLLGKKGEQAALDYAIANGYKEIARNVRTPFGEIDLILFDIKENTMVFVEVKTRTSMKFGYPEQAVTAKKMSHMIHSADYYIQNYVQDEIHCRVDVAAVIYDSTQKSIINFKWMKNVTIC